jgi:hypothetical protein
MSASVVLLPTYEVTLYVPDDADTHGWQLPPEPVPYWAGVASVQLSFGSAGVTADSAGGHGPFAPSTPMAGTAYLAADAQPRDGMVLVTESDARQYVCSSCRWVPDPSGGEIGCWTVNLMGMAMIA